MIHQLYRKWKVLGSACIESTQKGYDHWTARGVVEVIEARPTEERIKTLFSENERLKRILDEVLDHSTCYCDVCKPASEEFWVPRRSLEPQAKLSEEGKIPEHALKQLRKITPEDLEELIQKKTEAAG